MLEFEKTMVIFKIIIREFFIMQSFMQKQKHLSFWQKLLSLGVFGLWKSYCHIWNQYL